MYLIFDIETFPNVFLFSGKFAGKEEFYTFEISFRMNQKDELLKFLSYLQNSGTIMVGYNNNGFDYPIIHNLLTQPFTFDEKKASQLCQEIIHSQDGYGVERVRFRDRLIPQLDLIKINHFDNQARRVSLKSLQFAMRSETVEDLPFDIRDLNSDEIDVLKSYNIHDITETEKFFWKCKHLIDIRHDLINTGTLGGDVLNYSDAKIGTEYFIKTIGRNKCFITGSTPKQTIRQCVDFKEIILPKIFYRTEEYEKVLLWFKEQKVWIGREERPSLETELANIKFHFGLGGVHGSVENKVFQSNDEFVIKDIDVSGMYPAIAVANGFYPEHLGQDFVRAYRQLQIDRSQYPKGSTMNLILKLSSNAVFGNSNNPYSCFYDPKYTFSITVNGQLQLLQLAEVLAAIPRLQVIQANTDGLTVYLPREHEHFFNMWCRDWEVETGLKLEEVEYVKMWLKDVNNYLSLKRDGSIKAKGAYWFPKTAKDYDGTGSGTIWNKDFSNMVVQKAIEQVLINNLRAEDVVKVMTDKFDFMLRYKTPAGATVYLGDKKMPKTVRYYVSKSGEPMKKVSKPKGELGTYKRKNKLTDAFFNKVLSEIPKGAWDARIHTANKSKYEEVVTSIESGRLIKECNVATKFNWDDVDYDYYIQEVKKLIIGDGHV